MTDMPSPRPWHLCPLNHPDDDIQRVADALGDTVCWVELVNRDGAGNAALILAAAQDQSTPAEVVVHTSAQTATAVLGMLRDDRERLARQLQAVMKAEAALKVLCDHNAEFVATEPAASPRPRAQKGAMREILTTVLACYPEGARMAEICTGVQGMREDGFVMSLAQIHQMVSTAVRDGKVVYTGDDKHRVYRLLRLGEVLPPVDVRPVSDALWDTVHPMLPPLPPHPLGCHKPRVNERMALTTVLYAMRTRTGWGSMPSHDKRLCHPSSAQRRFQEWRRAGVFDRLAELRGFPELEGIILALPAAPGPRNQDAGATP